MSEYGGINMMIGKQGSKTGNKAVPRCGAAKGQGAGMGGYNSSAVNKAVGSIIGAPKPTYFTSGSVGKNMK